MKNHLLTWVFAIALCFCLTPGVNSADSVHHQTSEYATIRWAGRENSHVIRPSGQVEFVGAQLAKIKKPDRVDDRSFYMNVVMNALAKEGFEFAGISNDDIIMKRPVH